MLFVVRPKESTLSSAWPCSRAGALPSTTRHAWRSSRLTSKSIGCSLTRRGSLVRPLTELPSRRFARGGWGSLAAIRHVNGYRRTLMRRRLLGLGIGLGALLAFPATGIARTIEVFPGDSIQHAVHKAHSG